MSITKDDWIIEQNEIHNHHFHKDYTDDELEIMASIWEKYHNEFGEIDWHDHTMYNSAWYTFMTKILKLDEDIA